MPDSGIFLLSISVLSIFEIINLLSFPLSLLSLSLSYLYRYNFFFFFFSQSLALQGACECPQLLLENLSRDATVHLTGQDAIPYFTIVFFFLWIVVFISLVWWLTTPLLLLTIYFLLYSLFAILMRKNILPGVFFP